MFVGFFFLLVLVPPPGLIDQIAASGRCAQVGQTADERVVLPAAIAPGPPPVLSFRYFEDKKHHRFDNLDVMLDDAGH